MKNKIYSLFAVTLLLLTGCATTGRHQLKPYTSYEGFKILRHEFNFSGRIEELHMLAIDENKHVVLHKLLNTGTVRAVHVPFRDALTLAKQANAKYIVLAHNHPSGNMQPSNADKEVHANLVNIARTEFDIIPLDSLIVAYFDFTAYH